MGKVTIINGNFLTEKPEKLQEKGANIGMMNPPYSQGSKNDPNLYEIAFVEHLLDSLVEGGKAIVIIPQSSVTGRTKEEKAIKANILKKHTLEGVLTLNKDTFYGVGTMPCIAVFTAGEIHPKDKECKFIDFREDGYKISPHIGLIETVQAKDKKQHLLDVWFDRIDAESKFCVKTNVEADDEWLHSFYYFNDDIPTEEDFERTISDYLTFEFSMIMQNREYLFEDEYCQNEIRAIKYRAIEKLNEKDWEPFFLKSLFLTIQRGKRLTKSNQFSGYFPYISSTENNNGVDNFIGNDEKVRKFENCVTIANSGSVGSTFYHPYKFVASDHVTHVKNTEYNSNIYLFLATQLRKISNKYNFNREINDKRISKEKIMVPILENGNPDWKYMKQYMINLEIKKRQQYLKYINKKDK